MVFDQREFKALRTKIQQTKKTPKAHAIGVFEYKEFSWWKPSFQCTFKSNTI